MKHLFTSLALAATLIIPASAAITVPGADGTDGVLNITDNTEIDLSQAVTGTWNQANGANAGKGVYDPAKWAIVFKYASVTVAAGKTLTFKNHPSRAPVVWLVSGNVTIDGTVSLDGAIGVNGQDPANVGYLAEPGPGGFRGGAGYTAIGAGLTGGPGFGVGGGGRPDGGKGGSYGQNVPSGGPEAYGNPSLVPLIGGSGGGGSDYYVSGGGGGGALLIACQASASVNGIIKSNGGNGVPNYRWSGGGSGGGIRIVADTLTGTGALQAVGGSSGGSSGSVGRVRLERVTNSNSLTITPDPSIVPLAASSTALLWPPSEAPEVKIVSIGGANAPADPRASFGTSGADVALPQSATTQVIIETKNVEQAAQVKVRVAPRANGDATLVDATVSSVVSTSPLVVRWAANLPVNTGYSAVQVKVVRP